MKGMVNYVQRTNQDGSLSTICIFDKSKNRTVVYLHTNPT